MKYVLILTAIFSLATSAQAAPVYSAGKMTALCAAIERAPVTPSGEIQVPDTFDSGVCWGYFSTFPAMLGITRYASYPDKNVSFKACPQKPGIMVERIIAIFLEYAKKHPARYQEDAVFVALDAMKEAFPCPAN
jgi:hypothetical protein